MTGTGAPAPGMVAQDISFGIRSGAERCQKSRKNRLAVSGMSHTLNRQGNWRMIRGSGPEHRVKSASLHGGCDNVRNNSG